MFIIREIMTDDVLIPAIANEYIFLFYFTVIQYNSKRPLSTFAFDSKQL